MIDGSSSGGDTKCMSESSKATGIVYHEDMILHFCSWDKNFPECPDRFTEILKRCETLNILDRCMRIPTRLATWSEIKLKHSLGLLLLLHDSQNKNEEELEKLCSRYDSIFINKDTYRIALLAAGSTLNLVDAICSNEIKNGMAIIRPPGHHAMRSVHCGYCFFNNVALAAEYALEKFNLKKILIVDWDVHHGQATQQMFYDDPRVLYFSIHRYEHGTFWPNLRESNVDFIGEGAGKGFNFNIPLNKTGLGNADYLTIFHQLLLPVAVEYQPELILVSAGYDAAIGCPEGEMEVTPACYAHLVNSLSHLAYGKIAVILEGGYFLKSLAEGAALSLRSLLGDACPDIGAVGEIDKSLQETILNAIYTHKNYWECLQVHDALSDATSQTEIPRYSPCIRFDHVEEVVDEFPTRGYYPKRTEMEIRSLNARLDDLIRNTDLNSPRIRALLYSSPVSKNYHSLKLMVAEKGDALIDVPEHEDIRTIIPSIVEKVQRNLSRSVVIDGAGFVVEHEYCILEDVMNHLTMKLGINRILLVSDNSCGAQQIKHPYLNVTLETNGGVTHADTDNNFYINYPFSHPMSDAEFFLFVFKILLPIAYQYNPEIVIVSLSFSAGHNLSPESYSYLVHWLTSSSRGKLILIANCDFTREYEKLAFFNCWKILQNDPVPSPTSEVFKTKVNALSKTSLHLLIQRLKKTWSNLEFMVEFAEDADDKR